MRIILTGLAVSSLAACSGQPAASNQAAAPAPMLNASTNASDGEAAGLARFRSEWLEACVGGARDAAPPGAPVERHCACAIDRMMAGKTLAQLEADQASGAYRDPYQAEMRRCIREIPS